jgi:hypothetical protein
MDTLLVEPDHIVIEQYEEGKTFYIIAKGECTVAVGDER